MRIKTLTPLLLISDFHWYLPIYCRILTCRIKFIANFTYLNHAKMKKSLNLNKGKLLPSVTKAWATEKLQRNLDEAELLWIIIWRIRPNTMLKILEDALKCYLQEIKDWFWDICGGTGQSPYPQLSSKTLLEPHLRLYGGFSRQTTYPERKCTDVHDFCSDIDRLVWNLLVNVKPGMMNEKT